jgi:hypothetical protein
MASVYNPTYSEGEDQEDRSLRPDRAKKQVNLSEK